MRKRGKGCFSTTSVLSPAARVRMAAEAPAGPAPTITTSYWETAGMLGWRARRGVVPKWVKRGKNKVPPQNGEAGVCEEAEKRREAGIDGRFTSHVSPDGGGLGGACGK